jgi:DMSO/TMAO reductase YedYZ molybdopterin-dependent catalytic subunit
MRVLRLTSILVLGAVIAALGSAPMMSLAQPRQYSPTFIIEGMVDAPRSYTLADLQALPSEEVTLTFRAGAGVQTHTYRGVRLYDLLMAARPQFDPDRRNDRIRWYIHVTATDGYETVFAWGEIDPELADKGLLLAYEADGALLPEDEGMARLVVPGDGRGSRHVSNVATISVRPAMP